MVKNRTSTAQTKAPPSKHTPIYPKNRQNDQKRKILEKRGKPKFRFLLVPSPQPVVILSRNMQNELIRVLRISNMSNILESDLPLDPLPSEQPEEIIHKPFIPEVQKSVRRQNKSPFLALLPLVDLDEVPGPEDPL